MQNIFKVSLSLLFLLPLSLLQASETLENTVKFDHPEKYTDFEDRRYSLEKGMKSLMVDFEPQVIRSMTRFLPEGNTMQIVFTDIEMAGWISPASAPDYVRVIRDLDKVQLDFNYKWFDAQGNLLKEDKVTLIERNLEVLRSRSRRYTNTNMSYEIALLDRWLHKLTQ